MHIKNALFLAFLTPLACGADDEAGGTGNNDSEAGASDGADSQGDGDSDAATEGTTEGEPEWEPVIARGIGIDWVEANQAVGVRVGAEGAEVGGEGRTAFLLARRPTLMRAFWSLAEDWEPREIEARLRLHFPDGTEEVLTDRKLIDRDSSERVLSDSFFFGVVSEKAVPGLKYDVELYETGPGFEEVTAAPHGARLPTEGTAYVGIEDSYQVLKAVVVPFDYDDGEGCSGLPDISEETMQLFQDYMYQMNPIERLDFEVHAPVPWNQPLNNFNELNEHMSQMRFDEGADPEVYYYGLIDICAFDLNGFGGQAYGIPTSTSQGDAYQRVSSGLSLDPEWSAELFVHEVGHSQGRRHVRCNGDEGGANPMYPFEGGALGEWGFGVLDFGLRHPTVNADYMTYCHPAWVSRFGWNETYPVIRELSSWEAEESQTSPEGRVVVGSLYPDGSSTWITVPGVVPPGAEGATVTLAGAGGESVAVAGAQVQPASEGAVIHVRANVPRDWSGVAQLRYQDGDQRIAVDVTDVAGTQRF